MLLFLLFLSSCLCVSLAELEEAVPGQFPYIVSLKVTLVSIISNVSLCPSWQGWVDTTVQGQCSPPGG